MKCNLDYEIMRRRLGPVQSPVVSIALAKRKKQDIIRKARDDGLRSALAAIVVLIDRYFLVTSHFLSGLYLLILSCIEWLVLAVLLLNLLYDCVLCLADLVTKNSIKLTAVQQKLLGVTEKASEYISVPSPTPFGDNLPITPHPAQSTSPIHYLTPTNSAHSSLHGTPQSGSVTMSCTPTPSSLRSHSFIKGSPHGDGRMSDHLSLERFLRYEKDKDKMLLFSSLGTGGSPLNQFGLDYAPTPRKYHLSTRSHSPHLQDKDSPLSSDVRMVFHTLSKLGITRENLAAWTDRCRRWLAERVVCPVAKEIETVNAVLRKTGNHEFQLGSVTLPKLQQLAKTKAQLVPTLSLLVPYLELSTKQDYLVARIQELSEGSNLSAFHWNSGGLWKGKPWEQSLPNDSQIVAHLFCSYLDSQYPPNPQYPTDGKAFSSQHFIHTQDRAKARKPARLGRGCIYTTYGTIADVYLYQECVNPPEYKVFLKEKLVGFAKGRNNLFNAIAVFIHCVKVYNKSSLGPIHLDKSGINAIWITENL